MDLSKAKFEKVVTHLIRLEPDNFVSQDPPRCHLMGGNFVVCKGLVVGKCPRYHDPENGRNIKIARLPTEFRPQQPLQFAALSREAYAINGHISYSSYLVTLVVTTEGYILGIGGQEPEGTIDLSAIRFCLGKGISLVDDVSIHTCDVQGTRFVTLQGRLANRWWTRDHRHPLALLPESCRPNSEHHFIVSGTSAGGFHLLQVRPNHSFGSGGDLMWKDGVWNRDKINLTGVMFEVSPEALKCTVFAAGREGAAVVIKDFQQFLIRRFGSIEQAWAQAFDLDGSGQINFTEFGLGCKAAGYVGNATRIWAALDEDQSGEISQVELLSGAPAESNNNTAAPPVRDGASADGGSIVG
jgi:hypothetical protein